MLSPKNSLSLMNMCKSLRSKNSSSSLSNDTRSWVLEDMAVIDDQPTREHVFGVGKDHDGRPACPAGIREVADIGSYTECRSSR